MSWEDLDQDLSVQLYKLWNRLSLGSYFPHPVKDVEITKKDGGVRKLGIPTILNRIALEVVKSHLEPILDHLSILKLWTADSNKDECDVV